MVQVNPTKTFIRFKFKKIGKLQYVSHLDLVRTMHKIVVRSGLPLWYTEGFNPKPKMIFAAPLSIGAESTCEFLDLRLNETVDPELAKEALNRNMTEELQVEEAYYPESKFTDLKWLSYEICVKTEGATESLAKECERALSEPKLEVLKNTKSGEAVVDIRPLVRSADISYRDGLIYISCVLSADPSSFLNPEYLLRYLKSRLGILSSENLLAEYSTVMRTEAYFEDMTPFR